jgi:hypothetical membrane protein
MNVLSQLLRSDRFGRWLALGGVVGPIQFMLAATLAGWMRPGYSAIHQPIDDLGVGANAWLLNVSLWILGATVGAFALGFGVRTQYVLRPAWRWIAAILIGLSGRAPFVDAIFVKSPDSILLHSLASTLGWLSSVIAFLIVGIALRRGASWRRLGTYSLVSGVATLCLVALTYWLWQPTLAFGNEHLGGLAQRALVVERYAWFVVFGWWLFEEGRKRSSPLTRRSVSTA